MSRTRIIAGSLPAAITALTLGILITGGGWQSFGIWPEASVFGWTTSFADLAYITAVSDCMQTDQDITACDPYGRPFQPYGVVPGSILAWLGFGVSETGYLGVALAAVWVAIVLAAGLLLTRTWKSGWTPAVVALGAITLVAIAPPALLGIERGQIEVIVIALGAAGLLLAGRPGSERQSGFSRLIGAAALVISVVLKYLSVGLFLAFLSPRRWRWWAAGALAASTTFLVVNLGDLQIARDTARADAGSTSRVMFSSTTAIVTFLVDDPAAFIAPETSDLDLTTIRIIGAFLFVTLTAAFVMLIARLHLQTRSIPTPAWYLTIGGLGALVVPFLLGDSNDYRLMFLIVPMTGILLWINHADSTSTKSLLWVIIAFMVTGSLTSATMIETGFGFLMPRGALIAGDLVLTACLAFGAAVWLRALVPGGVHLPWRTPVS